MSVLLLQRGTKGCEECGSFSPLEIGTADNSEQLRLEREFLKRMESARAKALRIHRARRILASRN